MTIVEAEIKRAAAITPPQLRRPPQALSALRRIKAIRENPIGAFPEEAFCEDIVVGGLFGRRSFTLNTPAAIKRVLVDNTENYTRTPASVRVLKPMLGEGLLIAEGRAWRHQRRTLAPAFTPKAIGLLAPHILSASDETLASLTKMAGAPVNLLAVLQALALEIAGRTMFSLEMGAHGGALRDFVTDYGERLARVHFLDLVLPLGVPSPQDIRRLLFRRRWTRFIGALMARRCAAGNDERAPRDLFDLLLAARDPETGETFSPKQLGDQVATMILAGHETTAVALFWSLYLLALDGKSQARVGEEACAAAANGEPSPARLVFTRAVIDEAMRLYPPAYAIVRAAKGPDVVAGPLGDVAVASGDVMVVSPWVLHRHKKLWAEPDAFMPERFLPDAPPIDRFAYLPFGVGPRICVGAHFALTEATLVLAKLVGAFRIELLDEEPVLPVGVVTTQPSHAPAFRLMCRI